MQRYLAFHTGSRGSYTLLKGALNSIIDWPLCALTLAGRAARECKGKILSQFSPKDSCCTFEPFATIPAAVLFFCVLDSSRTSLHWLKKSMS